MECPFVVGQVVKNVLVNYVERPDLVWCSPPKTEEVNSFLRKVGAIELKQKLENVTIGTLAATILSEDNSVCRAKVLSFNSQDFVEVRIIDSGNRETKNISELYMLPKELATRGPLAAAVEVEGAVGIKDSKKNIERVSTKLGKSGLELTITHCSNDGLFLGRFSYGGKIVTFNKKKDRDTIETKTDHTEVPNTVEEKYPTDVVEKVIAITEKATVDLKIPLGAKPTKKVDNGKMDYQRKKYKPPMFDSLPPLLLNDGVCIPGTVTYISSDVEIWFSPLKMQDKLLTQNINIYEMEESLVPRITKEIQVGELCIAKSEDGCLYRAKVTNIKPVINTDKNNNALICVQFFDFGNIEEVHQVLEYPQILGLELAPAAIKIDPKRELPVSENVLDILETCLMGNEALDIILEHDLVKGKKVARFFENGEEILFTNKIETLAAFDKEKHIDQDDFEDVIVESECIIETDLEKTSKIKSVIAAVDIQACGDEQDLREMKACQVLNKDLMKSLPDLPRRPSEGFEAVDEKSRKDAEKALKKETRQKEVLNINEALLCYSVENVAKSNDGKTCNAIPEENYTEDTEDKKTKINVDVRKPKLVSKPTVAMQMSENSKKPGNAVIKTRKTVHLTSKRIDNEVSIKKPALEVKDNYCKREVPIKTEVDSLKSLLEKEFPREPVVRQISNVQENPNPTIHSCLSNKVEDWFAKNEQPYPLEGQPLNSTSFSSVPTVKTDCSGETNKIEESNNTSTKLPEQQAWSSLSVESAREQLNRMLDRAPDDKAVLMTNRDSSRILQRLIAVLPPTEFQSLLQIAIDNFSTLSINSSGCRVVQALLEFCNKVQQLALARKLENRNTLLKLVWDGSGTFVAQACLGPLLKHPSSFSAIVDGLKGSIGELGCSTSGTFFLQKLVLVMKRELGSAYLLHEEIFGCINKLVFNESGSRLLQVVLKLVSMGSVVRVSRWLESNMELVVKSQPAAFTAIVVVDRLVRKVEEMDDDWAMVLDNLTTSLFTLDSETGKPLLVMAAIHPIAYVMAKKIVSKANILVKSKEKILEILYQNLDDLRFNRTGSLVLKGLEGVV